MRPLAAAVLLAAVVAGCARGASGPGTSTTQVGSGATSSATVPSSTPAAGLPRPAHTVVVVMENHAYDAVLGRGQARWLSSLPAAVLTDWHGVRHPSQPNYVALFSGSTHGVTGDHCPTALTGENLATQLAAAGLTFAGYSEGLPEAGSTACHAGTYARKHNPWADYASLPAKVNQPLSAWPEDLSKLPTVAFVVPDLCHDTHNCPTRTGDAWLKAHLAEYVGWARTHDGLLVVTYDEDDDTAANHIPTVLVGPMVRPGRYDVHGDHYTTLRTLEALYGLPPLARAADREPLMTVWAAGANG